MLSLRDIYNLSAGAQYLAGLETRPQEPQRRQALPPAPASEGSLGARGVRDRRESLSAPAGKLALPLGEWGFQKGLHMPISSPLGCISAQSGWPLGTCPSAPAVCILPTPLLHLGDQPAQKLPGPGSKSTHPSSMSGASLYPHPLHVESLRTLTAWGPARAPLLSG